MFHRGLRIREEQAIVKSRTEVLDDLIGLYKVARKVKMNNHAKADDK